MVALSNHTQFLLLLWVVSWVSVRLVFFNTSVFWLGSLPYDFMCDAWVLGMASPRVEKETI